MASLRKLFGKRLRDLRTEKGYNQLYLGTVAGVSEDFISLVERGINQPSFETIESLAEALETDVTTLFTFPGARVERQRVRMVTTKRANVKSVGRTAPAKSRKKK